jgi:hypothetical protein
MRQQLKMVTMHANLTQSQQSVWRAWARPAWEGSLTKEQAFKLRPITDFHPSPGTLGKFMRCTHKRVLIRAPNQVGKTRHAVVKFVWQTIKDPGLYRVVGSTRKQSIDGVERELFLWIPPSMLHPDSSYSSERGWTNAIIKLKNGSQIQVRTNDQEVEAHAGPALKGVLMDEPPPMDKFTENLKRLNVYDGFMYLSFTPTGQDLRKLRKVIEAPGSGWVQYNPQLTFEDCPWLSPERIAAILKEGAADSASYRMRCFGDWAV